MLTPAQSRMARAALNLPLRDVAKSVGASHTAIAYFEQGQLRRISVDLISRLEAWYQSHGVYFGPASGVALNQDVFATERHLIVALWRVLQAHGIHPTSTDLVVAMQNESSAPTVPGMRGRSDDT